MSDSLSISPFLQELIGPLQTAFTLGLQYPPLANEALAALERWESEQPHALRAVAPQVVPLLDPYLTEVTDMAADADANAVPKGKDSEVLSLHFPRLCLSNLAYLTSSSCDR